MTNKYVAYTDGSALNTGSKHPGGSAYIIFDDIGTEIKRASKGFLNTTSNRMEILAIISVINSLPNGASVTIHSDSQYSINVLSGRWRASMNLDQITLYRKLVSEKNINVDFVWVKGHNGNQYNELCDKMARKMYNKMLNPLTQLKARAAGKTLLTATSTEMEACSQITTKGRRKKMKT